MATKKPEWMKEGDGFVDVTLSRPADMGGVKMTTLRMREPTVEDSMAASDKDGSDAEREVFAIACLVEQAPEHLRKLSLRDFKRLQVAYLSFTD